MSRKLLLAFLGWLMLGCVVARADEAADFYKGKTVTLVVGYGPGGGYDVYARVLLARHLGDYIPGHPTIIVQNMPGAGSLQATNYLYRAAPKDGTTFGTFARNMPLLGLIGDQCQNVQFDPRQVHLARLLVELRQRRLSAARAQGRAGTRRSRMRAGRRPAAGARRHRGGHVERSTCRRCCATCSASHSR